ncbi:lysozyme family protein [Salipiger aestuarii]|uniref:glycoside hydrolase family 104 protein n=1 Tax=Salipiger aestuarii TaxID=568098 RepID=UPI00123A568A|nr:glycoside hydrolase family 104 protein [Salipiger aestuarii]KAA8606580.1 hypothetical protein AL037_20195 [Salipiger aestuarii]
MTLLRLAALFLGLLACPAFAAAPLFGGAAAQPMLQQGRPLITPRGGAPSGGASLFAGRQGGSLFEPVLRIYPDETTVEGPLPGPYASKAERVRHIIARAEAGRAGYDAVQHGARRKPPKRPTAMTMQEIYRWIDDTPGQPHAIGRYQFIPSTLRMLVSRAGIAESTRFTPDVQDRLADLLLLDAGFDDLQQGQITRTGFMNNLAKIWAGLPTSSGQSHYHGYAGNKATMTWARFETEMAPIFPR